MSDKTSDVIVVGAGIIGCATAYYLAKKGVSVTVFEADEVIGNGGSTRAAACASPAETRASSRLRCTP